MSNKKKSTGRPPKPDNKRQTAVCRFMVTPDQKALLEIAAGEDHENFSSWARRILLTAAKEEAG